MIKKNKKMIILSSIVILIPMIVGLFLWPKLPQNIATHFSFDGQADNWSGKSFAVLGVPIIILAIHWICIIFTASDPKQKNIRAKILAIVIWICPIVSLSVGTAVYGFALNGDFDISIIIMLLISLLFIIIGNYMPKCQQNYSIGIKFPWTLNDEDNWNHTHRFAGKVWVIGGVILIVLSFLRIYYLFEAFLILMILIPMVYSYIYYIKHKAD